MPDYPRYVRIGPQWLNTHHRSGWDYVIRQLDPLDAEHGVLLDGFIEKKFAWGRDPGDRYNNFAAHRTPWVGVVHNPPAVPSWFNLNQHRLQDIFQTEGWKRSVVWCYGLITFSQHLREWLQSRVSVPVVNLLHPTQASSVLFEMQRFENNRRKRLVQVGWWLRRSASLFTIRAAGYQKTLVDIGQLHSPLGAVESQRTACRRPA